MTLSFNKMVTLTNKGRAKGKAIAIPQLMKDASCLSQALLKIGMQKNVPTFPTLRRRPLKPILTDILNNKLKIGTTILKMHEIHQKN